jgi:hypothetical protein
VAAEARVELVAVALEGSGRRRVLRRLPADLEQALAALEAGPG